MITFPDWPWWGHAIAWWLILNGVLFAILTDNSNDGDPCQ